MRRARGVRGGWWRGVGGMFRGLESGVWVQGVGDGGDGANLLDGAWMGFLRAGRTGRESGLGVGSVSGTFLMLDWEGDWTGTFWCPRFFWVSGAGTCGDGNYPAREEGYWNILFGMRIVLVIGEVW